MTELIKAAAAGYGCKAVIIPATRLTDLKRDLEAFSRSQQLNGFQKFIVSELYSFDLPDAEFTFNSIIVTATPVPHHVDVLFEWQGRKIPVISLARSFSGRKLPQEEAMGFLANLLKPMGHHLLVADRLPLKRLAVCSGLARYGRNNIAYVAGMGSFLAMNAFYTDVVCAQDNWHDVTVMDRCEGCQACVACCPTGALRPNRFLIDNERCLSFFNEAPGDFPEWLPRPVHHCLYDCLLCQDACPVNVPFLQNTAGLVEFDGMETGLLLEGKPLQGMPPETIKKMEFLGIDQWLPAMPRNIMVLFDNYLKRYGR